MEFRTIVDLPKQELRLSPESKVMLVGSCFAQHIGERLERSLPEGQVDVNPAGVLYNPASLAAALRQLRENAPPWQDKTYFEGRDGMWHNRMHATLFSAPDRKGCVEKVESRRRRSQLFFQEADVVAVTFGTDRAYFLKGEEVPVGNCHKEPAACFTERTLDFGRMREEWDALLSYMRNKAKPAQVVFTVSPYRYAKYGFHASAVSKGRLLQLVDMLCETNPNALYFPAYEIVTDELRDYRFYAPDMLHPSEQAVSYVGDRFAEWCFTPELTALAKAREKEWKKKKHRKLIE